MKIKPKMIVFILLGLFAFYMVYMRSSFKSKFGFGFDPFIVPISNQGYAVPISVDLIIGGQTRTISITIPANNTASSYTVQITGLDPANKGNVLWKGPGNTSGSVAPTTPFTSSGSNGIYNLFYPSTGSSDTQCISPSDATNFGYSTQKLFADDICKGASFSNGASNTSSGLGCTAPAVKYTCNSNKITNVRLPVPSFPAGYNVTYDTYDAVGALVSSNQALTKGETNTIGNFIPGGYIAVNVKTSGNTAVATYYFGNSSKVALPGGATYTINGIVDNFSIPAIIIKSTMFNVQSTANNIAV